MQEETGLSSGAWAVIATFAAIAVLAVSIGLVLDKAGDYKIAAAEHAWAQAAQTQAQAALVDARAAQIGVMAQAALPYMLGLFALLIFAGMTAAVIMYVARRTAPQQVYMLPQQAPPWMMLPPQAGGWYGEEEYIDTRGVHIPASGRQGHSAAGTVTIIHPGRTDGNHHTTYHR